MELIEFLKKLRAIKADSGYTKESRAFILNAGGHEKASFAFLAKEALSGIFRSGWSMALTAALLLMAIGSFSVLKLLYPITSAVVDVSGLKAEARAIDAQIELTGVRYDATAMENKTSTVSMALPAAKKQAVKSKQLKPVQNAAATESAAVPPPTIDSVLNALSE